MYRAAYRIACRGPPEHGARARRASAPPCDPSRRASLPSSSARKARPRAVRFAGGAAQFDAASAGRQRPDHLVHQPRRGRAAGAGGGAMTARAVARALVLVRGRRGWVGPVRTAVAQATETTPSPNSRFEIAPRGYVQFDWRGFPDWPVTPGSGRLNHDTFQVRRARVGVDGRLRRRVLRVDVRSTGSRRYVRARRLRTLAFLSSVRAAGRPVQGARQPRIPGIGAHAGLHGASGAGADGVGRPRPGRRWCSATWDASSIRLASSPATAAAAVRGPS